MLLLWMATALAAPCPDLTEVAEEAWAAFNDAELQEAKGHLKRAADSLTCQERVVVTEELLRLFRLDGLVSLAQEDRKGAVYATIRIVTIDPDAAPSKELGPELAELHQTWADRLGESTISVSVRGLGEAWVDGRVLTQDVPFQVIAGEHLIQVYDDAGWHAAVRELSEDTVLVTGQGLEVVSLDALEPDPPELPIPELPPPSTRRHRTSMLLTGSIGVAGGAGVLGYGWSQERAFKRRDYDAPSYGGCAAGESCYDLAREKEIRNDASTVRALYATGYVLTGIGAVVLGTELFFLPAPSGSGAGLGIRVKW
ncbi:MAG: hypothetical protein JRI25_09120 [Deltaproteobacteria bacterium]|nr:hypothetical protein [Deltaproteobacteria bacterium]